MTALICGISSTQLTSAEITQLKHPLVCGIILFTRNFEDYFQLKALVEDIKNHFGDDFLICVDQEGGRVRRFDLPFTRLPPLAEIGKTHQTHPKRAEQLTHAHAFLMASELLSIGIDMSFAPVIDIDNGSNVIGDRAFSSKSAVVSHYAKSYCQTMHSTGMKTTAKHFPGHGTVIADSHTDLPIDQRAFSEIEAQDLQPFIQLIKNKSIDAIMMSHVIYSQCNSDAAGYSRYWCQDILRDKYAFKGIIISDDLGMKAADCVGDIHARYQACVDSGCDIALACTFELSQQLLEKLPKTSKKIRFEQLLGKSTLPKQQPFWQNRAWQTIRKSMVRIQAEIYNDKVSQST